MSVFSQSRAVALSLSVLASAVIAPSWADSAEGPGRDATSQTEPAKPPADKPPAGKPPAGKAPEDKPADGKDKADAEPAKAKTPLGLRFEALSTTVGHIDAAAVPCKLGDKAVGCLEAAKAATLDLRLVRKQLAKDIRALRKAGEKTRLAHALEFGSSLNQLKTGLRSLGAADTAAGAQEALAKLREHIAAAKLQLDAFN